jgi:hypothetical protein
MAGYRVGFKFASLGADSEAMAVTQEWNDVVIRVT